MDCNICGHQAEWVENKEIYGKNYGKSYMAWLCRNCGAYVGCHQNTKKPLGTMADKELRGWRMAAHNKVDKLWRESYWRRGKVYSKLQKYFGKPIHIGEADKELCISILNNYQKIFFSK